MGRKVVNYQIALEVGDPATHIARLHDNHERPCNCTCNCQNVSALSGEVLQTTVQIAPNVDTIGRRMVS